VSIGSPPLSGAIYEKTLDCVHCGLCLTACPTYLETGRESASPRGRIYLMRGVAEGRLARHEALAEEAYLCLGCRACETACPAGVEYGHLLELTREAVDDAGWRPRWRIALERLALRRLVPERRRLAAAMTLLRVVQRLRLPQAGASALRLLPVPPLRRLGERLADATALMPPVPPHRERRELPLFTSASGERRGRVALFTGCVMSEVFADVHRATHRVLVANGFDVWVPTQQGCCGALQAHSGDLGFARELARANARAFEARGLDAIVVNSAGCGAALRDAEQWLGAEGRAMAGRVRDVLEWLDEVGLRDPPGRVEKRVAYDDPCHLVHGQGVAAAPRRVLRRIPGLELVEHADAARCCGAAGIYNLTQPEMSRAVRDAKMERLEAVAPEIVATGNPGCLMQIRAGARACGLACEVVHPVELLDRAYRGAGP